MRLGERAKNSLKVPGGGGNALKFGQMRNCKGKRTRRNRKCGEGLNRMVK
jgi:hypothetical protein